jgi:hypothetical protein
MELMRKADRVDDGDVVRPQKAGGKWHTGSGMMARPQKLTGRPRGLCLPCGMTQFQNKFEFSKLLGTSKLKKPYFLISKIYQTLQGVILNQKGQLSFWEEVQIQMEFELENPEVNQV